MAALLTIAKDMIELICRRLDTKSFINLLMTCKKTNTMKYLLNEANEVWDIDDILTNNPFLMGIVKTISNVESWDQFTKFRNVRTVLFREQYSEYHLDPFYCISYFGHSNLIKKVVYVINGKNICFEFLERSYGEHPYENWKKTSCIDNGMLGCDITTYDQCGCGKCIIGRNSRTIISKYGDLRPMFDYITIKLPKI